MSYSSRRVNDDITSFKIVIPFISVLPCSKQCGGIMGSVWMTLFIRWIIDSQIFQSLQIGRVIINIQNSKMFRTFYFHYAVSLYLQCFVLFTYLQSLTSSKHLAIAIILCPAMLIFILFLTAAPPACLCLWNVSKGDIIQTGLQFPSGILFYLKQA